MGARQPSPGQSARRAPLVCALSALILTTNACRSAAEEPHSQGAPPGALVVRVAAPARPSPCALGVWADLVAVRQQPSLQAARDQILGGLKAGTLELARSSGLDIDQWAREATLCEVAPSARGGSRRAMLFRGEFPPDLLERVRRVVPGASEPVNGHDGVVQLGRGWLGASTDQLAWADDLEALARALAGELSDAGLPRDGVFSMRMSRERANAALGGLARDAALEDARWTSVVVSQGRDGKSSEVRFVTESPEAATRLLASVRGFMEEAAGNGTAAKILAPAALTTEADDATVALRAEAPPTELLRLFTQLGSRNRRHKPPT